MEKVTTRRQLHFAKSSKGIKDQLLFLEPEMRLTLPRALDPGLPGKISETTRRLCAEDPIEFFDPYDPAWSDGSCSYEEDLRDVNNYFEYLKALDPIHGSGIPPYTRICYIDEIVGHGVFASRNIEKGEFIGFYTGEWRLDEGIGSEYLFEAIDDSHIFIDAKVCGNFTRFINHAYSRKCNLEAIIFLKEDESLQLPLVIYYAKKKIHMGQQLLINYGKQYWNNIGFKPEPSMN